MRYFPGIEETTATTGTGTITLAQVTGRGRFSDVFSDGEACGYTIVNGNNLEFGIGTYTATNTLARTKIIATLVSGAYDVSTPTAITLASTSEVYNSAVAMTQGRATAPLLTKQYSWSNTAEVLSGSWTFSSANRAYYMRHRVDEFDEWTGIACEVSGAQAASLMKCAVYTMGTDGMPDVKLDETADGSGASAVTVEMAFDGGPLRLSPGMYYLAWTADTGSLGIRRIAGQSGLAAIGGADANSPYSGVYESITSMTFTDPAGGSLSQAGNENPILVLYK